MGDDEYDLSTLIGMTKKNHERFVFPKPREYTFEEDNSWDAIVKRMVEDEEAKRREEKAATAAAIAAIRKPKVATPTAPKPKPIPDGTVLTGDDLTLKIKVGPTVGPMVLVEIGRWLTDFAPGAGHDVVDGYLVIVFPNDTLRVQFKLAWGHNVLERE